MKAYADISWAIDPEVTQPFTILSPIDCNHPAFSPPLHHMQTLDFCGCFRRGGFVDANLVMSRRAYVVGMLSFLWVEHQVNRW
jgi:hypothetical protein